MHFFLSVFAVQWGERFLVSVLHANLHRAGNYICLLSIAVLMLSLDCTLLVLFQPPR